ncbi:MAG: hydroxypyruvate isomerase family protein [Betaproteobacteria bacterium]
MPRFAANVSTLYPELALIDRIGAAARDGFAAVEVQGPYAVQAQDFRRALDDARVQLVLMNAPQGHSDAGERGLAALPGREQDFESAMEQATDYARILGAPRLHVMAGKPGAAPAEDCLETYLRNLAYACDLVHPHGITVTIEPINQRDVPGYYLSRQQQAADVIAALKKPNLGLQMDFYHLQIMEGDLVRHLERYFPLVSHVQIAGVPERSEPDTGEVHYPLIFALLDRLRYAGWVGSEYRPARAGAGGTSAGLGWLRKI